jgi:hypothetical protein
MEYFYPVPDHNGVWQAWPLITTEYPGDLNHSGYAMMPLTSLRPDLVTELKRIKIEPSHIGFFYIIPTIGHGIIHVDTTEQGGVRSGSDNCAINWVLTEPKQRWVMNYFQPKIGTVDDVANIVNHSYVEVNHSRRYSYTKFNIEDMTLVSRFDWNINPMLIRTDIPHNVEMITDIGPRLCASLRFKVKDFDTLKNIFESFYK